MARPKADPQNGSPDPLAIYLHWPYCARICPYCDFNVHRLRRAEEADALLSAMLADLAYWRDWTGARDVGSVHFGGGTPSLLTGSQLDRLLTEIDGLWGIDGAEIALEANPNDVTPDRIQVWSNAGLTRLSLGVQSFDNDVLERLGRDHSGDEALIAVEQAMGRINSVSADLIFGVTGERDDRLERDLERLIDVGVPHISTYQLTIEPGTVFARAEARGNRLAVDEEQSARDFEHIRATLTQVGYRHYEVSNFAQPGHESAHNLAYWQGQDYVGVGPGAHGRLWTDTGRVATETALRPSDYIDRVEKSGRGITQADTLSPNEAAEEYVLMGLRIEDGISLSRLEAIRGEALTVDPALLEEGLLKQENGRLKATPDGRLVLDALTRALLV